MTGWIFSRGHDHGLAADSIHLGVGGNRGGHAGNLTLQGGADDDAVVAGGSVIPRWEWQHLAAVVKGTSVRVYLNGVEEFTARMKSSPGDFESLFFGGRSDNRANWEGRLDEIAVFDRALTGPEVQTLAGSK